MGCGVVKSVGMMRKFGWVVTEYRRQLSRTVGVRIVRMLRMQNSRRLRQDARLTHVMQPKFLLMFPKCINIIRGHLWGQIRSLVGVPVFWDKF